MSADRRSERAPRIDVSQDVVLIARNGQEHRVRLSDLSRDGFKIEHSAANLAVGETVTIRTRRSAARAEIRWLTATAAGGTFIDAIDL